MAFPYHNVTFCGFGGHVPFLHQNLPPSSPPLKSEGIELPVLDFSDPHQVLSLGSTLTPSTAEDRPPDPTHHPEPTSALSNHQLPMRHDEDFMMKPKRKRGRPRGSTSRIRTIRPARKMGRVKAESKTEPLGRKGIKDLQRSKDEAKKRERKRRAYEACTHCRYRRQKCDEGVPCSLCKKDHKACIYLTKLPAELVDMARKTRYSPQTVPPILLFHMQRKSSETDIHIPTSSTNTALDFPPVKFAEPARTPIGEENTVDFNDVEDDNVVVSHSIQKSFGEYSGSEPELMTPAAPPRMQPSMAAGLLNRSPPQPWEANCIFQTQVQEPAPESIAPPTQPAPLYEFNPGVSSGSIMELFSDGPQALSVAVNEFEWCTEPSQASAVDGGLNLDTNMERSPGFDEDLNNGMDFSGSLDVYWGE
ncbi:hypothetical protein AYX13_03168 [Cryptococcus neoformans]|nr:hypothetical protein AYX13_03168 [Cryptococcus neoformans var. grubii]